MHRPRSTYLYASGIHFCYRLSKPQGLQQPEGLEKLKKIHSPHRVLNPRLSGLQHTALSTNLPSVPTSNKHSISSIWSPNLGSIQHFQRLPPSPSSRTDVINNIAILCVHVSYTRGAHTLPLHWPMGRVKVSSQCRPVPVIHAGTEPAAYLSCPDIHGHGTQHSGGKDRDKPPKHWIPTPCWHGWSPKKTSLNTVITNSLKSYTINIIWQFRLFYISQRSLNFRTTSR
jgi:hypothetical protein